MSCSNSRDNIEKNVQDSFYEWQLAINNLKEEIESLWKNINEATKCIFYF